MIRLYALGSGSKGNAFALETDQGTLLVDAGLSAKEWRRRAALVELPLDRVCGIALTHEHGDHTSCARALAAQFRVPLVATEGTLRAMERRRGTFDRLVLRGSSVSEVGPFSVSSCRLLHDAVEPAAIMVEASGVRLGIAYDFGRPTGGLRYLLRDLDGVILEANYDEVMLRTSEYPSSVQHRIAGSGGHLSNSSAARLLTEILHEGLGVVVLAHLSQECNRPELARKAIEPVLRARGFRGTFVVALQDEPLGAITIKRGMRSQQMQVELELEPRPEGTAVVE